MRFYVFFIISVFIGSANLACANEYADTLIFSDTNIQGQILQKTEAELLEKYITQYKKNINTIYESYSQEQSLALENANRQINAMVFTVKIIQTQNIESSSANLVMKKIVEDIKVLNIRMQTFLEQEALIAQEKIQKQAIKYQSIGQKISLLLDTFIEKMSAALIKKKKLGENDKEIIRALVRIRNENLNIKKFSSQSYTSSEEMTQYFQRIIENIRKEIRSIKNLSQ